MRLGGAFPFGQDEFPIALPSGGVFYPPAGNYVFTLGASTVLEMWDSSSASQWIIIKAAGSGGFISVDGFNFRLRNTTGTATVASFTAGSGATNGVGSTVTGVTLAFSAAGTNGRLASAYPIVGGAIGGLTLVTAGSGLLVPPIIMIAPPPPGGLQAIATCTISSAGVINGLTVANAGAGYVTAPLVQVIPQMGSYAGQLPPPPGVQGTIGGNAGLPQVSSITFPNNGPFNILPVITATITGSGTLTGVVMLDNGALYTGTPTVTVTGAGAATVTLNATVTAAVDTSTLQPGVQ